MNKNEKSKIHKQAAKCCNKKEATEVASAPVYARVIGLT